MRIILDSNIWISFLLGFQQEFIRFVLTDKRFEVYVCPQLLNEVRNVASRPKIQKRIEVGDVDRLLNLIAIYCHNIPISHEALSPIRDAKDLYLLSLAETAHAAYIVSGDSDLTDLQHHLSTRILTLAEFRRQIID
ncbi:MAG: putative toxin-antitoxin system toxin component, PIN family [Paludibacteraceae bacterium]|nr:putative toxin-antitoxin system toxin component, PIN family [Paludibacteraceae bacterium]